MPRVALTAEQRRTNKKKDNLDSIGMALGCGLVRARMTKPELASSMGVSPQTIRRWISNPDAITIGSLLDMCSLLGLDWRDLLDG